MENTNHINKVLLAGEVVGPVELITTTPHELRLVRFELKVQRLSGSFDTIPVVIPQESLGLDLEPGIWVRARGSYRSHNNINGPGPKLVLQVFTRILELVEPGTNENEITLVGAMCKNPVHRRTPLGREVTDVMLAVKATHSTQYIPVIAWGNIAKSCSEMKTGDTLALNGRIQSRIYQKKTGEDTVEERVAYEVSMMSFFSKE